MWNICSITGKSIINNIDCNLQLSSQESIQHHSTLTTYFTKYNSNKTAMCIGHTNNICLSPGDDQGLVLRLGSGSGIVIGCQPQSSPGL